MCTDGKIITRLDAGMRFTQSQNVVTDDVQLIESQSGCKLWTIKGNGDKFLRPGLNICYAEQEFDEIVFEESLKQEVVGRGTIITDDDESSDTDQFEDYVLGEPRDNSKYQ